METGLTFPGPLQARCPGLEELDFLSAERGVPIWRQRLSTQVAQTSQLAVQLQLQGIPVHKKVSGGTGCL